MHPPIPNSEKLYKTVNSNYYQGCTCTDMGTQYDDMAVFKKLGYGCGKDTYIINYIYVYNLKVYKISFITKILFVFK